MDQPNFLQGACEPVLAMALATAAALLAGAVAASLFWWWVTSRRMAARWSVLLQEQMQAGFQETALQFREQSIADRAWLCQHLRCWREQQERRHQQMERRLVTELRSPRSAAALAQAGAPGPRALAQGSKVPAPKI